MHPELLSLPACLNRSTAFVVFALAIFMIAAHTGIAAIVAQHGWEVADVQHENIDIAVISLQ